LVAELYFHPCTPLVTDGVVQLAIPAALWKGFLRKLAVGIVHRAVEVIGNSAGLIVGRLTGLMGRATLRCQVLLMPRLEQTRERALDVNCTYLREALTLPFAISLLHVFSRCLSLSEALFSLSLCSMPALLADCLRDLLQTNTVFCPCMPLSVVVCILCSLLAASCM